MLDMLNSMICHTFDVFLVPFDARTIVCTYYLMIPSSYTLFEALKTVTLNQLVGSSNLPRPIMNLHAASYRE